MIGRIKAWLEGLSRPYEAVLFRNRIVLTNTHTGRSLDRRATAPFSSDRVLIADIDAAVALLGAMIREMEKNTRFAQWPTAIVKVGEPGYGALSDAEARTICGIFDTIGFRKAEVERR